MCAMVSLWRLDGLTWRRLLKRVWRRFWADRILDQSAKLSFYLLLSLFPLLIFLIALFGLVLQAGPALLETLQRYLRAVAPASASALIDRTLTEIITGSGGLTLSLALASAIWMASQGMGALLEGLHIAYHVRKARPWWKTFPIAMVLTVITLTLTTVALLLLMFGDRMSAIVARGSDTGRAVASAWGLLKWPLLVGFPLLAFDLLYLYGSRLARRRWHWLTPGAVVAVALWLVASFGFKLYLEVLDTFALTYGSIGAVIILLSWLYLSGTAILVGAEVNATIEDARAGASYNIRKVRRKTWRPYPRGDRYRGRRGSVTKPWSRARSARARVRTPL
jgi:membrane protein